MNPGSVNTNPRPNPSNAQNNAPFNPLSSLNSGDLGRAQEAGLFSYFTEVQTVGTGENTVQMTGGRPGNPSIGNTPIIPIKLEPGVPIQPPAITHREAQSRAPVVLTPTPSTNSNNKRPGDPMVNPAPAKKSCVESQEINGQSIQQCLDAANTCFADENYVGAQLLYDLCLKHPDLATLTDTQKGKLHLSRGNSYRHQKKYAEAQKAYEDCEVFIEGFTKTQKAKLHFNRGNVFYQRGDYAEAKKAYEACMQFLQVMPETHKGFLYSKLSWIHNDPSTAMVYCIIGLLHLKNVPSDHPIKIKAVSFCKSLGSLRDIQGKLLDLQACGTSTIPEILDALSAIEINESGASIGGFVIDQY